MLLTRFLMLLPMMSPLINRATDFICKFEGFRPTPYICPGGYRTIGYGQKMEANDTTAFISEPLAREFVVKRCRELFVKLKKAVPLLSDEQYIALLSFIYNLGWTNFMRSTLRDKILFWFNPERPIIKDSVKISKKEISEQWMRWIYANGKPLEGLKRRREVEANLFFSGSNW